MSALATLVVVWLGAGKPDGREKAALDRWAEGRGAVLEEPRPEPDAAADGTRDIADRCDRDLDQARDQLNAGDDAAARRTLGALEQTLRDHPEVLQASWLMAERYRLEAQIAARSGENALGWRQRADALEGKRASSFAETERSDPPNAKLAVTLAIHGARAHETYWDGARTGDSFSAARGEHHLAIVRGKRVVWSGWVSVLVATQLDVWIPDAPPCSTEDLRGAAFAGETAVVPAGVRCGAWVMAAPGEKRGSIRTASCSGDRCQPVSTFSYEVFAPADARSPVGAFPGSSESAKKTLPGWVTWAAAGVSVAGASLILWQTGAFDGAAPAAKVVYDGTNL